MMGVFKWTCLTLASLALGGCGYMARKVLTTGPNGPQTPASVGLTFERASISSGGRHLDSYLVPAPPDCTDAPVVIIYHGVQETISDWVGAQRLLNNHCVTSLIFDYSGSGDSSRPASMVAVNQDGIAAYDFIRARYPMARIYTFGHSMGNGIMLEALPQFSAPPAGVIIANAFSSMRDFAAQSGRIYSVLAHLSPDWWDNVKTVRRVRSPILVVSSDADQVVSTEDGRKIYASANEPKRLVLLHGYKHNALYRTPNEEWWREVLKFVGAPE
jgi:uncharacterized protein